MMRIDEIKNELTRIKKEVNKLEPSAEARKEITESTFTFANDFLDKIEASQAFHSEDLSGSFFSSDEINNTGENIHTILNSLQKFVITPGLNPASGGHLGYIPGGGVYPSALADYLAAVSNKYAGIYFASPGAVRLENALIKWLSEIFNYPTSAAGHLASGGSIANLTAIVTARDAMKISSFEIPKAVIYLTGQVHHCIHKALNIAGLRESTIRTVDMDEHYRMNAGHLEDMIEADIKAGLKPFLVVASAGTTDTGAVDPIKKIGEITTSRKIWYHIDAAYGGFFNLLDEMKDSFEGIEMSDSLVVDPHKGLFLPYGIGAVIVKNAEALHRSHQYQANYMQDALEQNDELSPAELSPELTKHFRGLRMWMPLKLFGLNPFKNALWEKILLARYFYEIVSDWNDFILGPYPDLSVVIYRYQPNSTNADSNDLNLKLAKLIQNDGRIFISSTTIYDTVWLRLAVLSFRTRKKTIDTMLKVLREKIHEL